MVSTPSPSTSTTTTTSRSFFAKRGVGVTGIRRVKNPIKLAAAMLRAGDDDLRPASSWGKGEGEGEEEEEGGRDVPSAQGHTLLHGDTAEILAEKYGCEMVEPEYYFTQKRWDEHVGALEREKERGRRGGNDTSSSSSGRGGGGGTASWSPDEYLPQGTCGAVVLDSYGSLCVATSTGGLTNKLTGRIGDTPVPGAGFWAEEWEENNTCNDDDDDPRRRDLTRSIATTALNHRASFADEGSLPFLPIELSQGLRDLFGDCLPSLSRSPHPSLQNMPPLRQVSYPADVKYTPESNKRTRSLAISGTGNGDSFMRTAAARTAVAIARYSGNGGVSGAEALRRVAGPGGELQQSAGARWGRTGEGEGGMIGIERVAGHDGQVRSEIVQDHNCAGMFRAWVDDAGEVRFRIWRDD